MVVFLWMQVLDNWPTLSTTVHHLVRKSGPHFLERMLASVSQRRQTRQCQVSPKKIKVLGLDFAFKSVY